MRDHILVIDDEADIRDVLGDILEDENYNVLKAAHSEQALSLINEGNISLIILDIWLENSDMDGIEILKTLKSAKGEHSDIPVLMISGHGNVEMAVNAMRLGAYDFIEKPFKIEHMLLTVERALEQGWLKQENIKLKDKVGAVSFDYKTKSSNLNALLKEIQENAVSDARVLIKGEVGTGKSKLARFIHSQSNRAQKQLYFFKAADMSEAMIHSVFRDSEFEDTTVVFEHVDELSSDLQGILLKYVSEAKTATLPRILSTMSLDWRNDEQNTFSSALKDRLGVFEYTLPSLADRVEDIPDLIKEFSTETCKAMNSEFGIQFGSDAVLFLEGQEWKANIRQLKSAIEWLTINHIVFKDVSRPIVAKDVQNIFAKDTGETDTSQASNQNATTYHMSEWFDLSLRDAREQFEKEYLTMLIKKFRGNISQMAHHVDMERTALHRKLKAMGIRYDDLVAAQQPMEQAAG
ncbi:MAG: hypothetical protein COB76_03840 [Alphaproteobacteria bacterium]|nr:MAG: hypothetical protein COB76_03840 [Alphaproteobacteria bacterium]